MNSCDPTEKAKRKLMKTFAYTSAYLCGILALRKLRDVRNFIRIKDDVARLEND